MWSHREEEESGISLAPAQKPQPKQILLQLVQSLKDPTPTLMLVSLLQSDKLLLHQGATVTVHVDGNNPPKEPQALLLESNQYAALQVQDCLIQVQKGSPYSCKFFYPTGFSCHKAGAELE